MSTPATPADVGSYFRAIGSAWRGNWSDFDGRTLRDQMDAGVGLLHKAVAGELTLDDIDAAVRSWGACPRCLRWDDWCDCQLKEQSE